MHGTKGGKNANARAKFGGHATRATSFLGLFFANVSPPAEKP